MPDHAEIVTAEQVRLSDAEVAAYRDKGFIIVENIYSPGDVQRMRDALDELIATARGVTEHTDVLDLEPSHTTDHPRVRRIKNVVASHTVFVKGPMGK